MFPHEPVVGSPRTVSELCEMMRTVRERCDALGLFPLYHYTAPYLQEVILNGGFRMSTQGQGDGGVYLSTLGPVSYGVGTQQYEENIVLDCFGTERLAEYKGQV